MKKVRKSVAKQSDWFNHKRAAPRNTSVGWAWGGGVRCLTMAGVLMIASAVALWSQVGTTSTLVGLLTDSTGAVLVSAKVVATKVATGVDYPTVSNDTGNYTIPYLPIGTYRVTAELPGFERVVVNDVVLEVDQTRRLDITMKVGAVTSSTVVKAEAPLLDTENATMGQVVGEKKIQDLPLNGRNYADLTTLMPGVVPGDRGFAGGGTGIAGFDLVNFYAGGRNTNNSFLVDGVETRTTEFGSIALVPNLDSISQFKVETNSFSAQFGSAGNAVVNVVTASGTNDFHGTAYDYLRNDDLDARNFFDVNRPTFKRNQFGGTLGGPIIRNKVFFHSDYEGLRQHQAATLLTTVPTAKMRQGDFTEFQNPDGSFIPVINVFTGTPFPGNVIPGAYISPVGQQIVNLYPLPNRPGTGLNYLYNPDIPTTLNGFSGRIDDEVSTNDRVFGRYLYSRQNFGVPGLPHFGDVAKGDAQNLALGWTHVFSPTKLNNLRLAPSRNTWRDIAASSGKLPYEGGLGIQGINVPPGFDTYPQIAVTGEAGVGESNGQINRDENTYSLTDAFTWVHGTHSTSFGFFGVDQHENNIRRDLAIRGVFAFLPYFGGQYIGDAIPEVLIGHPLVGIVSIGLKGNSRMDGRAMDTAEYAQDDWKVTPRLTLNLGIRYEYYQPWVDAENGIAKLTTGVRAKAGAFPNGIRVIAGTPEATAAGFTGRANRALYFPSPNDWAPRIGFAWRPFANNDTVVRGAYGLFYSPPIFDGVFFPALEPPLYGLQEVAGFLNISDPMPPFNGDFDPLNGYTLASNYVTGYVQQWNLSVERRISNSTQFQIAYVGNKGTHLDGGGRLFNGAGPGVGPTQPRRPLPEYGLDEGWDSSASTNYNSLQAKVERHFTRGLSFLGAYTFSKAIDTGAGMGDTFAGGDVVYFQNSQHPDERGLSLFDVRQRLVLSWTYSLPFGKGRSFLQSGGISNALLGGWQVNGIFSKQSGFPLTPVTGAPYSGADAGAIIATDRPNRIKDGNLPTSQRTWTHWFDTTAFVANNPGQYGDSGRGIISSDGIRNWDISLFKEFQLKERARLQFRTEVFNAFNNVNFGFPDLTLIDATFGEIGSAGASREIQFALKLIF